MYWYNYLYADKKVHHISRLKYKIEKGMPSVLLQQSHYPKESLCIVGIGSSRGAALELIRKIIDEVYREQGNFDIPSYLQIGRGSMPESGVTQP